MRKRLSIKNKITLSTVSFIILFGVIAATAIFFIAKQNFTAITKRDINLQTIEQSREIGQMFADFERLIKAGADRHELSAYLERVRTPQDPYVFEVLHHYNIGGTFESVSVLDQGGAVLTSTDPSTVGSQYGMRDFFKRALAGESIIEVAVDPLSHRSEYYVAYPIRITDGSYGGALVGKISGDAVDGPLRDSALHRSGNIMFIDGDGIIFYSNVPERLYTSIGPLSAKKKKAIADSGRLDDFALSELPYTQVIDTIRAYVEPTAFEFRDTVNKDDEFISIAHVPNTHFFLIVEANSSLFVTPALTLSITLGIIAFFAALIAAALIYSIAGRLLRPIGALKRAAEKIQAGDYAYRPNLAAGDEFGDVADAFSKMAQQLQTSYSDLEQRVAAKTSELSQQLQEVEKKNVALQNAQRAVLNVLEDSRALELQLQEERDRFEEILSSMGEGLFVLDRHLRIVLANPMAERILGITVSKLQDVFLSDIITFYKGKDVIPKGQLPLDRVIREGAIVSADSKDDLYWEVKEGKRFALGLVAAPIAVGDLIGEVVIFRDLTWEKNLDEARTNFISITSHQLRTPLTSLKWFLEMLMDGSYAQPLTSEQYNFASLAYQAADRMMGIINLLLQIARVEAGRVKIVPVPTDLQQFSRAIVTSLGNVFAAKKQTVQIIAIPDPLPLVSIDNDIMGQVLQNLLSNANRYGLEDTNITITFAVRGNSVVCSVADKGIGITKADAVHIFEKFYRAENALRMVPEGSGLGLSLVKSLVEGWGGKIWFESAERKGTTFFFTLPLAGMVAREGEVGIRVS